MKKRVALLTAAILAFSSIPMTAMAEEAALPTFHEIAEEQSAENMESLREQIETSIKGTTNQGTLDLTASLGDAGKGMLGMFLPIDLSSLQSVGFHVDAELQGSEDRAVMTLNVNDTPVVTIPFWMDLETLDFAIKAPDLSDKAITGNYNTLFEMAAASQESPVSAEDTSKFLNQYFGMIRNLQAADPEEVADKIVSSLETYKGIFLDYVEDYDAYQDTVSIDDLSTDATIVSGFLYASSFADLGTDLITTLKADEDFAALIASMEGMGATITVNDQEIPVSSDTINALLDSALEQLQDSAEAMAEDTESGFLLNYVLDENDDIIGRDVYLYNGEDVAASCSITHFVEGADHGYDLSVSSSDSSFEVLGTATEAAEGLEGTYTLYTQDTPALEITAAPLALDGKSGHFIVTLAQPEEGEEENPALSGMELLGGFEALVDFETSDDRNFFRLALASSGVELAAIALDGTNGADLALTLPEKADFEGALNFFEDQAAQGEFLASLNPAQIFANLQNAGISEDLLNSLMGLMSGQDPYAADNAA